jgi:tRNA(Ile)-lysidine synthase
MDAARQARYRLMADWAAGVGISHIVLGHTADDQAETFLMGLAREAGIDGLVGMRRRWDQGDVRFVRPFLVQTRADLRSYLQRHKVDWIDDPSNSKDQFERVKARRALKALKPLGITVDRLNGVISHLLDAQGAVLAATRSALDRVCSVDAGEVTFDRRGWQREGSEVQRRLLIAALVWVSGSGSAPRGAALFRLGMSIHQGKDATLAGCRIRVGDATFRVVREPKSVLGTLCGTQERWDGRWRLDGPHAPDLQVRPLGPDGLRLCKNWRNQGRSRDALIVSPAVWRGDVLVSAPLAGFGSDWDAQIDAAFGLFAVSH